MIRVFGAARWLSLLAACALIGAGCARRAPDASPSAATVVFWTTEVEQDRMALQRDLAAQFHELNPSITVEIVPVREQDLDNKLTAASAAGDLPDVVRVGLEYVKGYAKAGVLSSAKATAVIRDIGRDKFFAGPLKLVANAEGEYDAVPMDGWAQGIWYRKDWFQKEGLAPPDTWNAILAAAQKFNDPAGDRYGIVLGTAGQETYTQQTFEHVALSGGARLFTPEGKLIDPNEPLRQALVFYEKLAAFGPPGSNAVHEARRYYLTGRAAMVFYSPYIVDDIAGLAPGEVPVEGLAGKTGFVSVIHGPGGHKAAYGQLVSLGIVAGGNEEGAAKWVEFLLGERYLQWCFMTPGGKTPVLKTVIDVWQRNEVFASYEPGFARSLAAGMDDIERWGYFPERVVPVIADVYGKHVVPQAIAEFLAGNMDVDQTLDRIESEIRRLEAMR